MRPGQASKDERATAQGERRGERTVQNHAPGAAIVPTLEACPGRNYEPISILKTGTFLTFCPLSNASKIGTAQNKVYGTFNDRSLILSSLLWESDPDNKTDAYVHIQRKYRISILKYYSVMVLWSCGLI